MFRSTGRVSASSTAVWNNFARPAQGLRFADTSSALKPWGNLPNLENSFTSREIPALPKPEGSSRGLPSAAVTNHRFSDHASYRNAIGIRFSAES